MREKYDAALKEIDKLEKDKEKFKKENEKLKAKTPTKAQTSNRKKAEKQTAA